MLFLGIDVGTGGSRAVLIDETGTVVASHATEHVPFQSKFPGWAEQDPEDWWRASQESIRTVLSVAACKPEDIAAVGLTGQMHGAVLLDSDGQVLR
ncbi:MAG: FGGY family carbohydrate kinase, partial [Acidobacteriaceae bacterium]